MVPSRFKGATGSASVAFIVMAVLAWAVLPLAHPVYAVVIPPVIALGVAFAVYRVRRVRPMHPTIRSQDVE